MVFIYLVTVFYQVFLKLLCLCTTYFWCCSLIYILGLTAEDILESVISGCDSDVDISDNEVEDQADEFCSSTANCTWCRWPSPSTSVEILFDSLTFKGCGWYWHYRRIKISCGKFIPFFRRSEKSSWKSHERQLCPLMNWWCHLLEPPY